MGQTGHYYRGRTPLGAHYVGGIMLSGLSSVPLRSTGDLEAAKGGGAR